MNPLVIARTTGFIEVDLPSDMDALLDDALEANRVAEEWERECGDAGRHAVLLGAVAGKHFVAVALRKGECQYVLDAFVRAFLAEGLAPAIDPAHGLCFYSGLGSRKQAVAVARRLVEIDATPRDSDLEVAFLVMSA